MPITYKLSNKPTDPRSGIALALSCFFASVFLYFQQGIFGQATSIISVALIIIGLVGLATELNKLSTAQVSLGDDFQSGKGIFDNFGYGLAILILWIALSAYFPIFWVRAIISPVFFFAIYTMTLGIINGVFDYVTSKRNLGEQQIRLENDISKQNVHLQYNESKYRLFLKNILLVISGIVAFFAALLQILQILKEFQIID